MLSPLITISLAALALICGAQQKATKPKGFGSWVVEIDAARIPADCLELFSPQRATDVDDLALVWFASQPARHDLVVEVVSLEKRQTLWKRSHDATAHHCHVTTWTSAIDAGYLIIDAEAGAVTACSFLSDTVVEAPLGGGFVAALPVAGYGRRLLVDCGDWTQILEFDGDRFATRRFEGGSAGRMAVLATGDRATTGEWILTFDDGIGASVAQPSEDDPLRAARMVLRSAGIEPPKSAGRASEVSDLASWERLALRNGTASALIDSTRLHLCIWDASTNGGAGAVSFRSWSLASDSWVPEGPWHLACESPSLISKTREFHLKETPSACVPAYRRTPDGLGARYFCAATAGHGPLGPPAGFLLSLSTGETTLMTFVTVDEGPPKVLWLRSIWESNMGETSSDEARDGRLTLGIAPSCADHYSEHSGVAVIDLKTGKTTINSRRKQW